MLPSLLYFALRRLLRLLTASGDRDDAARDVELLVLRHQLRVLSRGRRLPLRRGDRILLAAASRLLPRNLWRSFPVSPQTVLRWHRELVRCKWTTGTGDDRVDRESHGRWRFSFCDWQERTRAGATYASRASSRSSGFQSQPVPSAHCFVAMVSHRPRAGRGHPGRSSYASKPPASWPATSSAWRRCG